MVDVVVSMNVDTGGLSKALEWAKKLIAYENKAGLASPEWSLLRPITGDGVHRLVFAERHSTMSEFEELYRKRRADSGWMALIKEMGHSDFYLDNSRQIYDVVESTE